MKCYFSVDDNTTLAHINNVLCVDGDTTLIYIYFYNGLNVYVEDYTTLAYIYLYNDLCMSVMIRLIDIYIRNGMCVLMMIRHYMIRHSPMSMFMVMVCVC